MVDRALWIAGTNVDSVFGAGFCIGCCRLWVMGCCGLWIWVCVHGVVKIGYLDYIFPFAGKYDVEL